MKKRMQKYTVEGHGDFPIEMLWAEGAYPANPSDVSVIRVSPVGRYRVQLRRWVSFQDRAHLLRGWAAYGWQVVESQLV